MLRGLCSQEAYRALSDCAAAVMWRSRSPSASEATLTGSYLARAAGWIGCRRCQRRPPNLCVVLFRP